MVSDWWIADQQIRDSKPKILINFKKCEILPNPYLDEGNELM